MRLVAAEEAVALRPALDAAIADFRHRAGLLVASLRTGVLPDDALRSACVHGFHDLCRMLDLAGISCR